ncbi:hypothetical protein DFJ58DRAFT_682227, partial [Suillus subalutaceus]|uniref:uncharacterized protein n=1 Tax=Suillus subalutaceus TaxID=48586 RepID=UPI001B85DCD0
MSKASSTSDRAENHTNEKFAPEQGTPGPPDNSEENEHGGPSAVKLPSGISNTGPSQSSEPHKQESVSKVAPDGYLALGAEKDQPTLNELSDTMKKVLEVLQNSSIVPKTRAGKDNRSRFWRLYGLVAAEHDSDFIKRCTDDMESILLFSGLFSTVSSSFIVAMDSNLSPDLSDTTNALLTQLVQIGLGNFTAAGSTPVDPASTWSPTVLALRIQMVAYASLSMSLLAAFGAVLGKQW